MNPKEITPPAGGWKENTFYVVDVAFAANNPIHRSIFFTGFLDDGVPGGYNKFFCEGACSLTYNCAYYLKAIAEIDLEEG